MFRGLTQSRITAGLSLTTHSTSFHCRDTLCGDLVYTDPPAHRQGIPGSDSAPTTAYILHNMLSDLRARRLAAPRIPPLLGSPQRRRARVQLDRRQRPPTRRPPVHTHQGWHLRWRLLPGAHARRGVGEGGGQAVEYASLDALCAAGRDVERVGVGACGREGMAVERARAETGAGRTWKRLQAGAAIDLQQPRGCVLRWASDKSAMPSPPL